MKVIITGAKGMLGQDMVAEFQRRDYEVHAANHKSLDITDIHAVRKVIEALRPDVVVNCAAYTNVDKAESEPEVAMRVNGLGPRNLALACEATGAVLLHISTDYVFDGEKEGPYEIWDTPNPINVYGKSKLWGEKYVRSLMHRYFIVRTSWLFGKGGRNFVTTMLELAKRGEPIRVVDDQWGCPTYTVDLAKACADLLESGCFGIYHVTNQGATTWYEFAKKVFELSHATVMIEPITSSCLCRPAVRPKNSVLEGFPIQESVGYVLRMWQLALGEYLGE
ncbi:MAG TPA: dTDP-4-dehydrorhamnose reductase [Firmicutes bacterium]|nr:dTDP-4-dehydrorhamnose reductase [Bacillota bacterium]